MSKPFLVSSSAVGLPLRLPFLILYLMASVLLEKTGVAASHQRPMPFARRSVMFVMEFLPLLWWKEGYDADGFFLPTLRTPPGLFFQHTPTSCSCFIRLQCHFMCKFTVCGVLHLLETCSFISFGFAQLPACISLPSTGEVFTALGSPVASRAPSFQPLLLPPASRVPTCKASAVRPYRCSSALRRSVRVTNTS